MTTKRIHVTLEDGRVYSVPAHAVAHDRATYYAEKDADTTYEQEYEITASDDYELGDWLLNNMNWYELPDVRAEAIERGDLADVAVEAVAVVDNAEEEGA